MRRVALVALTSATAVLALAPGTASQAAAAQGYAVTRIPLTSRIFGIAVDSSTGLIYAGGYGPTRGTGAITVIDSTSQAVEGSVTVPAVPTAIAVDPATNTVYASSTSGLTVINGATDEVTTTIASVSGVAVDPATDTVYAATTLSNDVRAVAVIDGATNSITSTVAVAGTGAITSLAVDTSTDTIYAATDDGTLTAINGVTNAVIASAQPSPDDHITSLAADPATSSVYAVNNTTNTVDVVKASTLTLVASITGCPEHVLAAAADPAANAVLVTSYGIVSPSPADSTCVIDTSTNTVAETFPRGGQAIAADPATGAAYIAAWYPSDDIWVAAPSTTDQLSPMAYGFGLTGDLSATFAVGLQSSRPLTVSALPAATIAETGALPAGITMSSSGVFSGTAAAGTVGTYPITVSASNGISPDSTLSLTIVVDIAPAITSPTTATFQTGVHGSFTVQATGDPAPSVQAVDYPSWLTFAPGTSSGVLSGTPPPGSGGVYPVYVWATNGYGSTPTETLTLTVNQPPAIAVASRLTFRVGHKVRYLITSTGFPKPTLREQGRLPDGLVFRASGGSALIVGKPARSDDGKRYRITIIASNGIGHPAAKTVTIFIR